MLNNIPAHNHTVYSYLQALLTVTCVSTVQPVTLKVDIREYTKYYIDKQTNNAE